jgi:hypothetical protein
MISIPCSGCSRKFTMFHSTISIRKESYCLDCEVDISDLEEDARNNGLEIGLGLKPKYINRKIIIEPIECIYTVSHIYFQKFEIYNQEMKVKRDIKRKHYMNAFMRGYKIGTREIQKIIDIHQEVMNELKIEIGKKKAPIYLIHHANHAQFSKILWDYNLISLVKKFIH